MYWDAGGDAALVFTPSYFVSEKKKEKLRREKWWRMRRDLGQM